MNSLHILLFSLLSLLIGNDEAELVFAGDAMQHKAQIDAALQADGNYSYDDCFLSIKPYVQNADYAIVNLETPLAGKPYTGYPCFSAPDNYAQALADAGFDLMLTANNHSLDKRDRGAQRTIDTLDKMGITHIGTYHNQDERDRLTPFIQEIKGFKVAFLNYTYGTNGISVQGDFIVNYINNATMEQEITLAREKGAEIIIACIHWGNEYQLLPHSSQKSLANHLINQGVDIIIGGHPHVIQPMEMRQNDKGKALVVYSLGNFISNMKTRDTRGGAMVKIKLQRDDTGQAHVANADYRLIFTIPTHNGNNFRLTPVEEYLTGYKAEECRAFVKAAESIFTKYNIDVKRDTSKIEEKANRLKLLPINQLIFDRE
ncbi:MAG: CapA family protein [Muribaculaceae bacterium]|nr:CapA family protein [Muribaculaceae bacterium]